MCTVKKDLNISETSITSSVGMIDLPPAGLPPPKAPADYDLINRQQSQLLLDMIYATKKPCFFSTKVPCPGTPAAQAVAEKGLAEELASIKAELAEIKAQLGALPGAIIGALKQEQAKQIAEQRQKQKNEDLDLVEVESETEGSEDEDLEDFDRLSSSSSSSVTAASVSKISKTPICEKMSSASSTPRTVSMSSDIEVLSSFHHCTNIGNGNKPACFGSSPICSASALNSTNSTSLTSNSTEVPMNFSISKELGQLNEKLKSIELSNFKPQTPNNNIEGKAIANNIFSHWADRFASSTAKVINAGGAPTGNIVQTSPKSPVKILPYSSAIDLNHWLK